MKVDIVVDAHEYVIREIDPTDSWDAGEYGLSIHGVKLRQSTNPYDWSIEAVPGDAAVVVVEHYSDGSTFGSNEYADVKGIFKTHEEAEQFAGTLNTHHGYFGSHIGFLYFDVTLPS